jgi:integrase
MLARCMRWARRIRVLASQTLSDALHIHELTLKEEKLKYGWAEVPSWLFVTKAGTTVDPANVRRAMLRVLKAAQLPQHFTPHCLRHTYAPVLLADGVSPVYVQEQLGHATIELTVSTYGRWLKKRAPGTLDRWIFRLRCKVVAKW